MAQLAPRNPLILFNAYLDDGTRNLAGKTITYKNTAFEARVLSFGTVDRSIPYPPGQMQVNDCTVELADTDGQVKAWFDAITPLRRIGEIIFEFESTALASGRNSPVPPGLGYSRRSLPLSEPVAEPLYTGEIIGAIFPPGRAIITLKDITSKWFDRVIPKLITRDNFHNLPNDLESAFAPIIFGRVVSFTATGVEPQGVILCPHIDTTLHRYCVARHFCHSVITVYRKRKNDAKFKVVSPLEYSIVEEAKTINGIIYTFTYIEFTAQQQDTTLIQADVSGINYRFDFSTGAQVFSGETRNPVDAIMNLIYYLLKDEVRLERFNGQSFIDTRAKAESLGMKCDGAITENLNVGQTGGVTVGQALSWLTSDFLFDFYQSNDGRLTLSYYDPTSLQPAWSSAVSYLIGQEVSYGFDRYQALTNNTNKQPNTNPSDWDFIGANDTIPIDTNLTLKKTVTPSLPVKVFNRIRYRYFRQNAGLTEYIHSSATGQWGDEQTLDNAKDQDEMLNTNQNPLLEEIVELHFIRDEDLALDLMTRRMGYLTLRSYPLEFQVPVPEVIKYLQLAKAISFTHYNAIAPSGWTAKPFKVYGVAFDLGSLVASVKAICYVPVPDTDLIASWTGTHPAHDTQVRVPPYPVLVNGTIDPGTLELSEDAEPQVDLNDTYPPAPVIEDVSVDIIFEFEEGGSVTLPPSEVGFVNVRFQEDQTTAPRKVSAYVPIPNFRNDVKFYTGTLYPDERPTGLTDDSINRVIFYSTDFNHSYRWVGTSELGTASGWMLMDDVEPGAIEMRIAPPVRAGYHKADGTTGVRTSDYKGDTALVDIPDLITVGSGGDAVMLAMGSTFGAITAGVASNITASAAAEASHTHTVNSHHHNVGAHNTDDAAVIQDSHNHTLTITSSPISYVDPSELPACLLVTGSTIDWINSVTISAVTATNINHHHNDAARDTSDTAPGTGAGSSHTHTITVNNNAVPKTRKATLIPYQRL